MVRNKSPKKKTIIQPFFFILLHINLYQQIPLHEDTIFLLKSDINSPNNSATICVIQDKKEIRNISLIKNK